MGRRPEIIEGEYEVIDEWDADETYYRRQDRYAHINPDPPYVTYGILGDKHWDMADYEFYWNCIWP